MKTSQILLGVVGVIILLAVVIGVAAKGGYNSAIGLDEEVHKQWAEVQNQLQRRYDLIPNIVASVKGTAAQEQKVFLGIAEARKAYFEAKTQPEQAKAAGDVERALSRLLVFSENYPELKSNEAFLKLQDQLEGTENRLSVARGNYNDAARVLNQYVRQFPSNIWASLAGVHAATYFEIESAAKTAPKVDFGDSKAPSESKAPAEKADN